MSNSDFYWADAYGHTGMARNNLAFGHMRKRVESPWGQLTGDPWVMPDGSALSWPDGGLILHTRDNLTSGAGLQRQAIREQPLQLRQVDALPLDTVFPCENTNGDPVAMPLSVLKTGVRRILRERRGLIG